MAGLAVAGLLAFGAAPALANAPNPIAGTTKLDSAIRGSDGSITVTVQGQWTWTTQTGCPKARNGVGYQVAWFDGNTANAIGSSSSPDGVLYVGDSQDNIVHSIEALGGSSASGNAFWDGVPSSYLSHNTTAATPDKTDAGNWLSNCDNVDSSGISSGTWGPISHTYPAGTQQITLCPVMYDPHGGHDNSGQSSVKDITAGGSGHNDDNSYEGNGTGTNGNACLKSSFSVTPPASKPSTPAPSTPTSSTKAKKVKRVKKHKKHPKRISRRPQRRSGFTG